MNPGGLLAWAVATGIGVYLKVGLSATNQLFATWGLPITFGIAFGIYGASLLLARSSWFELQRPRDPVRRSTTPGRCASAATSANVSSWPRKPIGTRRRT